MILQEAITQYFDAKDLETTAKALKDEATTIILEHMKKASQTDMQVSRGKFIRVLEKKGTKTDLDAFKLSLLGSGVGAETITECETASQKPDNRSEYITFKPKKADGK